MLSKLDIDVLYYRLRITPQTHTIATFARFPNMIMFIPVMAGGQVYKEGSFHLMEIETDVSGTFKIKGHRVMQEFLFQAFVAGLALLGGLQVVICANYVIGAYIAATTLGMIIPSIAHTLNLVVNVFAFVGSTILSMLIADMQIGYGQSQVVNVMVKVVPSLTFAAYASSLVIANKEDGDSSIYVFTGTRQSDGSAVMSDTLIVPTIQNIMAYVSTLARPAIGSIPTGTLVAVQGALGTALALPFTKMVLTGTFITWAAVPAGIGFMMGMAFYGNTRQYIWDNRTVPLVITMTNTTANTIETMMIDASSFVTEGNLGWTINRIGARTDEAAGATIGVISGVGNVLENAVPIIALGTITAGIIYLGPYLYYKRTYNKKKNK
jgi:hypothetical protein